jgi:TetR/AcrR family transcriptional regulator
MRSSGAERDRSGKQPTRRAPAQDERQRDPERRRQRILDAAVAEFSAKGFAGARVAEIAARAGVNSQLITYYFGGKNGLYDALRGTWEFAESAFSTPDQPFAALVGKYFDAVLDHSSWARLLIWEALGDGFETDSPSPRSASLPAIVEDIRRRQETGELTKEFDPETILIVLWSAVMAPVTMSQVIQEAWGTDLRSPEFRAKYAEQLKRLFAGPETETALRTPAASGPSIPGDRVRPGGTLVPSRVTCPPARG